MEFLKFCCCLTVEHGYMFDFVIRRKGECWVCCMPSISQFSIMIMRVSACLVLGLQQGSWCFCFESLHGSFSMFWFRVWNSWRIGIGGLGQCRDVERLLEAW